MLCDDYVEPDKYTFTFSLKACSILRSILEGAQVHGCSVKFGVVDDVFVCNTLIHMYANCGCFEVARRVLDKMPQPDVISWNALLSAYVEMGLMVLARGLFDEMPERNLESWNFLISGYVDDGQIEEARVVFDEMPVKNVVSWNAIITGYVQLGTFNEVVALFEDMQKANVRPDSYTFVNVLSACAGVGALRQGEWIHAYIDKNGVDVSGFLATALVDMYSKCGCVEKASEVFQNTLRKNISTWNAMIAGLSVHGLGEQALEIFSELLTEGFKPNEVTFVSVLSACSRAGLLEEGRRMFDQMVQAHEIQPTIEHYGCIVDLLGRFGLLEEAEELAKKIPCKEAQVVWESLLGACRSYGDVERAEYVARMLLDLDPLDTSGYVQLSNIKALLGRFNEAVEVRRMMKMQGVRKDPGCSMIEVDGVVHEFVAGETMVC